jgi:uncharacterized repeat protein (TIGR01451 family)
LHTLEWLHSKETLRLPSCKLVNLILGLMILLGSFYTSNALAGSPVSLYKSYAGNLSYVLAGASFRTTESTSCFNPQIASSAAGTLSNLPTSANVVAAYVYWTASYDATFDTPDTTVTFESRILTDFSPETETFPYNGNDLDFYSGKAEVTSIVESRRNGQYTMSDLDIEAGNPHCTPASVLGGWALVVIFEDDSEPTRVVNLYDGFQLFRGNGFPITANNFEISSNPSGKHAHITWEGDVGNSSTLNLFNEALTITTDSGTRELTDSTNPSGEQFNSRSNIYGAGNPTYGLDIDEYDISSYLTPGEKSFTTNYSSGGDLVLLTTEITSVSNITVADLSVTTSNPTSWLEGSTISKKFTISNNGPNDVPINSVEFNTTLPSDLTFNGAQGDSDWSCSQNGQSLSCIYKPKLRAGWSDYLDLTFDVANVAPGSAAISVSVNHDNAPYDIFDNQAANDIYQFTTSITGTAVVDLSASSKTYSDISGDLLLAEDTLRYTITIDDASNLAVNGITVTDDLPANIALTPSAYTIISSPVPPSFTAGTGINGTGTLTFTGIDLAPGATEQIVFEVKVDASAQEKDSLRNIASISYGTDTWQMDTGDITVTVLKPDLSPSTIEAIDKNGGLLESGDAITVQVTLDDLYDNDITTLKAIMNIPALIDSFSVIDSHTGTEIPNTYIDIQNISFSNSETPILEFEFLMDPAAVDGDTFDFTTVLSIGADTWTLVAPTLMVTNSQTASTGNKQLYLDATNNLSRARPTSSTIDIANFNSETWQLTPTLQNNLTFSITDVLVELYFEGNRYKNNGTPGNSNTSFTIELNDDTGRLLASKYIDSFSMEPLDVRLLEQTLDKNTSISTDEVTLASGQYLTLSIYGEHRGGKTGTGRRATLHTFDSIDTSKKADGYSAVVLNVSTVINVDSIQVWDKPFSDNTASQISQSQTDTNVFIRAEISDPFGAFDISSSSIELKKTDSSLYDFSSDNTNSSNDDPAPDSNNMYEINSTGATKAFEKEIELLENQFIGHWFISVTGLEGVEGDVEHTQIQTFKIIPFQPNISLSKSIEVLNDPINGISNPKAIPDAELKYAITAKNIGRGYADDGSLVLKDDIPTDAELYIGNLACINRGAGRGAGPVCFHDGTSPNESGLTYDFATIDELTDDIQFSQDGSDFTYSPVDGGDGYDSSIRFIKISPSGNLNASDKTMTFEPQFTFEYQIRLN